MNQTKHDADKVADIICDAGGKIVGRTRLQKLTYFFELAGIGEGFTFEYRHYGPYSESLATASREAHVLGLLTENEYPASWGGFFSIYETHGGPKSSVASRGEFASIALSADAIELELAATAAFISTQGENDPWGETERRKPDKAAAGRLEKAKDLYRRLQQLPTPNKLPMIA